jgi:hypothetical protein
VLIIAAAVGFVVHREAPGLFVQPTPTATHPPVPTGVPVPQAAQPLATRPLHLPALASGSPCPAAPGRTVNPNLGPALGDGPVYLVGEGANAGSIEYAPAANFHSRQWGGQKTFYAISPKYQGYVVLRGHQLDGPNELRFGNGDVPPDVQAWEATPGDTADGWTIAGDYTRIRAPGCYGVQADGTTFGEVIVFQAAPGS